MARRLILLNHHLHHLTSLLHQPNPRMFTSPTLLLSLFAFISSVHGLVIPAAQELGEPFLVSALGVAVFRELR